LIIGFPSWDPGGKRIVFHARTPDVSNGDPRIYYVDADGNGVAQQVGDGALGLNVPSWSLDGEHVLANTTNNGRGEIYRMRVADGATEPLIEGDVPRESFDGTRLYYAHVGRIGLFSRSLVGSVASNPESVAVPDYRPLDAWQLTRDGLYYVSPTAGGRPRMRYFDFATNQFSDVHEFPAQLDTFSFSADGATLWYSTLQGSPGSDLTLFEFAAPR
jgi:Tol biopolymer transport system component